MIGAVEAETVADALAWAQRRPCASSPSARADALLLLAHALQRPPEWIVTRPESRLSAEQRANLMSLSERRLSGEPIAYIVGSAGFYGREFAVDHNVLVPRPETEHLIDEALEFVKAQDYSDGRPLRVLDVGTGCGAIACTMAAETGAIVDGTDVSMEALEVASRNAGRLGVSDRCRFYHGDVLDPVRDRRYSVVIANLPYVPTADLPRLPSPVSFEPRVALDGGRDGLTVYRRLIAGLPPLLESPGLVLCEAAPPNIDSLADLVGSGLRARFAEVKSDYGNLRRYVTALI